MVIVAVVLLLTLIFTMIASLKAAKDYHSYLLCDSF